MITTRALAVLVFLSTSLGGCLDFVEPDFPGAGAPALLQVTLNLEPAGSGNISGVLVPGLTFGGFVRDVPNDTLLVNGLRVGPINVRDNGTREYQLNGAVAADPIDTDTPFEVVAPPVEEVTGRPPDIRWYTITKLGGDTIAWTRGTDLVVSVDTALVPSSPSPQIRQWFLEIAGATRSFRLSSDGLPPGELRIPTAFVPAAANGIIRMTLSFQQSGNYRSPANDYIGSYTFRTALQWIVEVAP